MERDWQEISPTLSQGISFLTHLFAKGLTYSAINTARSTLSMILPRFDDYWFGKHPVVCRVMGGVCNRRPQVSPYGSIWGPEVVLHYLRELSQLKKLTLRGLSAKLLMLMLLTSCQRVQTVFTLKTSDIVWSLDGDTAVFDSRLRLDTQTGVP